MLKSMTGFGKRQAAWGGSTIVAEVRSVNHRYREVVTRLPKGLMGLEEELKGLVYQRCHRGRIDLSVVMTGDRETPKLLKVDLPVAKHYYRVLRELRQDLKLNGSIDVAFLASFREIFSVGESPIGEGQTDKVIKRLVAGAVRDMEKMRHREGRTLLRDIRYRLGEVQRVHGLIQRRLPQVVRGYFQRMKARVEQLVGKEPFDESRLNQELAMFADRCDITEELTRLESHVSQFETMARGSEPVGRKLDFLLQEMGREVNTIGSKANDAEISNYVVQVKSELEKIREQVQNVE